MVNVQPRARPWQLPRIRRGMKRPASTSVQAGNSGESPAMEKCAPVGLESESFCFFGCDMVDGSQLGSPMYFCCLSFDRLSEAPFYRGTTSTSQPFEVGIPVPSVSPPIRRHVGGP
jgi:hypothetical protein